MAYSELIKNFNKIRGYLRDFYIYGFKRREEYAKSGRTYDNERRRIEDWLGDYMRFRFTPEGKAVFLSIDSRYVPVNPLFKAFTSKSFTDVDLILHVYILSLLSSPQDRYTAAELLERICALSEEFPEAPLFDESTLRKKLKEYLSLGILRAEKEGNKIFYLRADECPLPSQDALAFFSEVMPCGVLAYFLRSDKNCPPLFRYKHRYCSAATESEILFDLFAVIREKRKAELSFKNSRETVLPLAVYIGTRTGRQYAVVWSERKKMFCSKRLDRILSVRPLEVCPDFDGCRARLREASSHMWGASFGRNMRAGRVSFTVRIGRGEEYIFERLNREKRCGTVTRIDEQTARFYAEVYDAAELLPWIRSFLGRIVSLDFSDRRVENRLKSDFLETCRRYGIGEDV